MRERDGRNADLRYDSVPVNAPLPRELAEQMRPAFVVRPPALLSRSGWAMTTAAVYVIFVLVPAMNLYLPAGHPFHLSDYFVSLAGKIMCYAIVALAMDLIWGYTGRWGCT